MLVCCSGCGRDVQVLDKEYHDQKAYYCSKCGGRGKTQLSDEKGRSARSSQLLGGQPSSTPTDEDV